MRDINNKFKLTLLFFVLVFPLISLFAETDELVKGVVKDTKGNTIADVVVYVDIKSTQVLTNFVGVFVLKAKNENSLSFSKKGYKPINHIVDDTKELIVVMNKIDDEPNYPFAFGTRSKSMLTGSISVVESEQLAKSTTAIMDNSIQGHLTALTVMKNGGSEPGWESSSIYIRGVGTFGAGRAPMVIVDDVERDYSQLSPDEIESITVLKDAAATVLYGNRAANGVLLVKTKRGYLGKTVVSLNANFGMQTPSRLPDFLSSQEYVRFRNMALQNDGYSIPTSPNYNPSNYDGSQDKFTYANTNWYNSFLNKTAPQQTYNVSLRGGNESLRYFVLFGNVQQSGLYKFTQENPKINTNVDFTRYNLRSNVDVSVNKNLTVGVDLGGRLELRNSPNVTAGTIFTTLSQMPPTMPVLNRDNSIAGTSDSPSNPYGLLAKSGIRENYARYIQGNINALYKLDFILKGLSANALFAFDSYKLYSRSKSQNYATFEENSDGTYTQYGETSNLSLSYTKSDDNYFLKTSFNSGLTYETKLGEHGITADLKALYSIYKGTGNNADIKTENYFGRFAYNYAKKYVADFACSYAGSENFIGKNRYQFFPVGSLAWNFSKEEFLKDNKVISFAKLRASYGLVGNADIGIGRFPYLISFGNTGGYIFGDGFTTSDGSWESRITNPNIGCEKSLNANLGLDIDFFNGELSFSGDIFNQSRTNIINDRTNTLPLIVGQILPYENIGSVENNGFELAIKYSKQINEVGFFANANVSYARNKITYKDEVAGQDSWVYRKGHAVNQQWGLQSLGLFQTQDEIDNYARSTYGIVAPGDVKYLDKNDDGVIDLKDEVPLGNPSIPEWNFGLNMGGNYKGFDISILFVGVANRSTFVNNPAIFGMWDGNNITDNVYNTWQKGLNESSAIYPKLSTIKSPNNIRNSSLWLMDGSYLRIQNIEFGYTFPRKLVSKLNILEARLYVNGNNLFSLDSFNKYKIDPDAPVAGVTGYPVTGIYSVGFNLKF